MRRIALVCGPNCELETQAIRAVLESFGAHVITYWIGRPNDLISVLSGSHLMPGTDLIILSFHGDEGTMLMPVLDESVYLEGETTANFGASDMLRHAQLDGRAVIATGCTLGAPEFADALLSRGCSTYIGANGYPESNDVLMFLVRLLYEYIGREADLITAYELARSMNAEMAAFQLYQ